MVEKTLKILLLEDMRGDQELIKRQVRKFAPKSMFTIANNRQSFLEKIEWMTPDIILADYNLPDYSGLQALLVVKEKMPHIPFMFVTGKMNDEEKIAEVIMHGASGYLLKENLTALPEKLQEIFERAEKRFQEEEVRRAKERRNQMLLQKITELVRQSENFKLKNQVEEALDEINETSSVKGVRNAN